MIVEKQLLLEMFVDESLEMIMDESLDMIEDESFDMIMDESLMVEDKSLEKLVDETLKLDEEHIKFTNCKKNEVGVSKQKVFRAKKMAYERVVGNYTQKYAQLRDYCLELKERNPNTTIKIEVERPEDINSHERKFKRIYVCLDPLKEGFRAGRRDLLGLDGCFLSGQYPGDVLFSPLVQIFTQGIRTLFVDLRSPASPTCSLNQRQRQHRIGSSGYGVLIFSSWILSEASGTDTPYLL
ncbi:hypothetical protein Tco_1361111 [Tanacetum coccineum]